MLIACRLVKRTRRPHRWHATPVCRSSVERHCQDPQDRQTPLGAAGRLSLHRHYRMECSVRQHISQDRTSGSLPRHRRCVDDWFDACQGCWRGHYHHVVFRSQAQDGEAEVWPDYLTNYKTTPNWAEEANKITEGRGVDFVLEIGGSGSIAQSVEAIAQGGIIAVIGFLSQAQEMPDVAGLALGKGCIIRGVNVGSKQLTEDMVAFVCGKKLVPPVEKEFASPKTRSSRRTNCLRAVVM
ncbi:hypothetical protein EJ03DRAFT_55860 [Teratosphaeria nubilosa]|uniref:Alcohol dehydrogenase-like C-terminal domain-containing protein n=1 Tax=Teratosphaeria nubilosa TaxID=161662 RepID=A0A6G1LD78_9PEZI|nr:hypothetical protein EJ03DRAFT_55860 [Teratosphaeria nubilosa]